MNDTKQIEVLKSLAEAAKERETSQSTTRVASVRVSPGAYLATASLFTFCAALLVRSGNNFWALIALGVAWIAIPMLAATDRILFDGERLTRRGVIPTFLKMFFGGGRLSVPDFESVETNAVRTLRRGGSVRYRYRSQIVGKGMQFVIASGGKNYRTMIRTLFPLIHEDKLDSRSRDLRDYLVEPHSLDRKTKLSQLAPVNVLAGAATDFKLGGRRPDDGDLMSEAAAAARFERANLLRRLANELRVAGRLAEAGEAFRRALNVFPHEASLIYDFARLLRSQASAHGDARLLSRARAALRLASLRAGTDANLLALIGETTLECGDARRAQRVFHRALDINARNVKARFGLADVALREGKLAHVIHHHRDAALIATEKSVGLFARREADYYARLNDDDEYLATELRRINLLQHANRVRRLAAAVINTGVLVALAGSYFDSTISMMGWSLASSAVIAWLVSLTGVKLFSERRKAPSQD